MDKLNHLDELPIASLSSEQLTELKLTEERMNQEGSQVYLIAFEKEK